ncbi:hypothetical protein BVC93_20255 [Mycobacterium sp. MS1601]|uniref:HK97 gp10 family phage protein n=1 Tax=Mycobacterium sp. MS1601 TaxID=1936029 RepID=UPI0009790D55|nr:HK97 gp10 family phage protein [Mycobacterium sp. MS1601]AQA04370.1 hypothetical protein BVC93_20255 [Mycobacterium sp. MS1601]
MSKKNDLGAAIVRAAEVQSEKQLTNDLARELRKAIEVQGERELKRKGRTEAKGICDEIKQDATVSLDKGYATGQFVESNKVKNRYGRGKLPSWRIETKSSIAHFLEYGTDDTEEHAFYAKAALRHGGTPD